VECWQGEQCQLGRKFCTCVSESIYWHRIFCVQFCVALKLEGAHAARQGALSWGSKARRCVHPEVLYAASSTESLRHMPNARGLNTQQAGTCVGKHVGLFWRVSSASQMVVLVQAVPLKGRHEHQCTTALLHGKPIEQSAVLVWVPSSNAIHGGARVEVGVNTSTTMVGMAGADNYVCKLQDSSIESCMQRQ
jgi:hypothetical protein